MKRLYIAAVAGLCAVAQVRAQESSLAPTAPVVPAPQLQNGSLVAPAGGTWAPAVTRPFANNMWSPVRSPVAASGAAYTGYPPQFAGAACGPTGCAPASCERGGFGWDRLKSWLCFNYSPSGLPKRTPAPYVTPLQGLFSCSSGAGCAPCAANGTPLAPAPVGQPPAPAPLQMPAPMKPPGTAGAVLMPSRGTTGAPAPTAWQNPAAAQTDFGTVKGSANPKPVSVVPAGYRVPQK